MISRKHIAEAAVGMALAALAGWGGFMVKWGGLTARVEAQDDRTDGIERRLEDFQTEQRQVNERVLGALGRIEGKVSEMGGEK